VFSYVNAAGDGNNAAGGGLVEFITDIDWSVDRIQALAITFANNFGAGTGADLATSATNAINAAIALGGGGTLVAAQFTFGGRTYLAMNTDAVANFNDASDLLFDITGVTGTISAARWQDTRSAYQRVLGRLMKRRTENRVPRFVRSFA
jgi:hypothetical protein